MNNIQWVPVDKPRFQKWDKPGDGCMGEVVWYDPYRGERDFNKEECGFLDLLNPQGQIVRVVLDKPNLNEKVRDARPQIGDLLGIKFAEEKRSAENPVPPTRRL